MQTPELSTVEDRADWFSSHFGCDGPKLDYDPDEPDQILITDELIEWTNKEGASLDWLLLGDPVTAIGAFRERHKHRQSLNEEAKSLTKLQPSEQRVLSAALKLAAQVDADFQDVVQTAVQAINELREDAAHNAAGIVPQ